MESVAITGLGIFVSRNTNPEQLFQTLYRGTSLIEEHDLDEHLASINSVCSRVSEDQMATVEHLFPNLADKKISRSAKMAVYAAKQAAEQSGFCSQSLTQRLGLFVGCNKNITTVQTLFDLWKTLKSEKLTETQRAAIEQDIKTLSQNQVSELTARELFVQGPVMTFGDACTAGASAIISGQRRILSGELDVAICGASEYATQPLMQMSFSKLGALSPNKSDDASSICRPFDKDRSGCILADGSAFLVLENIEHAKKRGAKILGYLAGAHRQTEAHKLTSTDDSGCYYEECIRTALKKSTLEANDIQHINAHGTSTVSNDQAEGRAIESIFYKASSTNTKPSVTSTKSALGHSLAASGALEAVLCVQSLIHQKVLPTLNYQQSREDEANLYIVTKGQEQTLNHVMSNSFGFGGENACLVFSKS